VTRLKAFVSNPVERICDADLPYVALEHIEPGTGRLLPEVTLEGKEDEEAVAHQTGDVRFGKLRPYLAKSLIATEPGVGSGELLVLRPNESKLDSKFLFFITLSKPFVEWAVATSYGVKMPRTSWEAIAAYAICPPTLEEQRRIAFFLDAEVARIDALVGEQEQTVALLWERRRASVFDAVTGRSMSGLRKAGVPWVDSVPDSWDVVKLTTVATLGSGHTPARSRQELWEDCTIPWITTGEVWQIRSDELEVLTETREMISQLGVAESAAVVHPAQTVVLCRTAASAGYSALMGLDMATSQDFATWTCGPRLVPDYLLYCLRAMRRDLLERLAMGSTHRTIYMPEIKSIVIPLPPYAEQMEIVRRLRDVLQRLDVTRRELELQLALLREHRQALITTAVTGGLKADGRVT
jgi:type I restriction enzyme S subunit